MLVTGTIVKVSDTVTDTISIPYEGNELQLMATQRTRNERAKHKEKQWVEGAAYELTEEEKEKIRVARLVWKARQKQKRAS